MTAPATYHTPAGWAERCTMRDDKAEHQIRIYQTHEGDLVVSCTCGLPYMPITTGEEALTAWRNTHNKEIA